MSSTKQPAGVDVARRTGVSKLADSRAFTGSSVSCELGKPISGYVDKRDSHTGMVLIQGCF